MKVFLEFIPILFFFLIFKLKERVVHLFGLDLTFGGIYSATVVLMVSTVLIFGFMLVQQGRLTRMQWLVVGGVLVFGSLTLLFRSEAILKWKAPVINWIIAVVFLASQHFKAENMAKTMFGQLVTMPDRRWKTLNFAWACVFFTVGTTNLFVAFTFPDYWVDFKLFGSLGILILASLLQIPYIYPYMNVEPTTGSDDAEINAQK